jgi:hypothetical protein
MLLYTSSLEIDPFKAHALRIVARGADKEDKAAV